MGINYCNLTWEQQVGTTASGNLSTNKRYDADSDPVKTGYRYKLCKYSTQNVKSTESEKVDHSQTQGRMRFFQRGRKSGWMCFDDNCPYYTTILKGRRYFEI